MVLHFPVMSIQSDGPSFMYCSDGHTKLPRELLPTAPSPSTGSAAPVSMVGPKAVHQRSVFGLQAVWVHPSSQQQPHGKVAAPSSPEITGQRSLCLLSSSMDRTLAVSEVTWGAAQAMVVATAPLLAPPKSGMDGPPSTLPPPPLWPHVQALPVPPPVPAYMPGRSQGVWRRREAAPVLELPPHLVPKPPALVPEPPSPAPEPPYVSERIPPVLLLLPAEIGSPQPLDSSASFPALSLQHGPGGCSAAAVPEATAAPAGGTRSVPGGEGGGGGGPLVPTGLASAFKLRGLGGWPCALHLAPATASTSSSSSSKSGKKGVGASSAAAASGWVVAVGCGDKTIRVVALPQLLRDGPESEAAAATVACPLSSAEAAATAGPCPLPSETLPSSEAPLPLKGGPAGGEAAATDLPPGEKGGTPPLCHSPDGGQLSETGIQVSGAVQPVASPNSSPPSSALIVHARLPPPTASEAAPLLLWQGITDQVTCVAHHPDSSSE